MNLEEAAIGSMLETISVFGMSITYIETLQQSVLSSGNQVNIIIGFTEGLKGNAMLGMDRETALSIISSMMGGMQVEEFDELSISAIVELGNMVIGNTFINFDSETVVNFTPPTIVSGDSVTLMMSRVATIKLCFEIEGKPIFLLLSVESAA